MKLFPIFAALTVIAVAPRAQAQIACSVDWNTRFVVNATNKPAVAGSHAYGLNLYKGFDPLVAGGSGSTAYKDNVKWMNPGIVRYSRIGDTGQMADSKTTSSGWVVDPKGLNGKPTWDRDKIRGALRGSFSFYPTKLMNIAGWPEAWQDAATKKLKREFYGDYADFCADLVRAINIDMGPDYAIDYWEVMNEPDAHYKTATEAVEMAEIYRLASDKIRALRTSSNGFPTKNGKELKVGGPAFLNTFYSPGTVSNPPGSTTGTTSVNLVIDKFVELTRNRLDFLSYHQYATEFSGADNVLFERATTLGGATDRVRKSLVRWPSTTRTVSLYHDEWNMYYNAFRSRKDPTNPADPNYPLNDIAKQQDVRSAIFDAMGMASMIKAGADATMAWNESDGWYGKMGDGPGYARRHSTYLFNLYNTHLRGNIMTSSTGEATRFYIYPVISGSKKNFVVVNQIDAKQAVKMTFTGATPTGYKAYQITKTQLNPGTGIPVLSSTLTRSAGYELPGYSVTVFVQDGTAITSAPTSSAASRAATSPSGAAF